jgi:hypothetical protein
VKPRPRRGQFPFGKAFARLQQRRLELGLEIQPAPGVVTVGAPPPPPPPPPPAPQRGWRPLGPFAIPHGQTLNPPGNPPDAAFLDLPIAGRISALALHPTTANRMLAGSAGGGIWETTDGGRRWTAVWDQAPSLAIGAIAYDPTNPQNAYAGTGEGNALADLGAGVLRSNNGGAPGSWAHLPFAPFQGHGFFDLLVDPTNGNHLLAAMDIGIWESANAGVSWTRVHATTTWGLSWHATGANAQASREVLAATQGGLRQSLDRGHTWGAPIALPLGPPPNIAAPGAGWQRLDVAHAPSNGATAYVFAADGAGFAYLVRRTVNEGTAFAALAVPPGVQTGQSSYDWYVEVDPANPNTVNLGHIGIDRGSYPAVGPAVFTTLSPKTPGNSIHPDQHVMRIDPAAPNTLLAGCDGGLFRSTDGGTNWTALNVGLGVTEFEYIVQHPQFDAVLIGGTQDNGTQRFEGSGAWYMIALGDGGDCAIDVEDPSNWYHTHFSPFLMHSPAGADLDTWVQINPPTPDNFLFYAPIEANGSVVATGGTLVHVSRDHGVNWQAFPLALAAGDMVSALELPTPDRLYIGTQQGTVWRMDFGPGGWGAPTALVAPFPGAPANLGITDFAADPRNPDLVWITGAGTIPPLPPPALQVATPVGLVASHANGGVGGAWQAENSPALAGRRLWAISLDLDRRPSAYVASDRGVFRSTGPGNAWTTFGDHLPNVQIRDLAVHHASRMLRAGTTSRGVWELSLDAPPAPNVEVFVRSHAVDTGATGTGATPVTVDPFAVETITRWWESPDIRVDTPPYLTAAAADVTLDVFADDHGGVARGLRSDNPQAGATARVFVLVHNRGYDPAANIDVRVYATDPCIGFPPLAAGFWTGFPGAAPPAGAWQPVAASARIPGLEPGRPEVVAFDWPVPADAPQHLALLAAATPAGTALNPAATAIGELVGTTPRIGLINEVRVRPQPGIPRRRVPAVLAFVCAGGTAPYRLDVDPGCVPMVAGAVLSPALAGATVSTASAQRPFVAGDFPAFGALLAARAGLGAQLDQSTLFVPPVRGPWLSGIALAAGAHEPLVLLLEPVPRRGRWCVVQHDAGDVVTGGLTLRS